jgi:hypothetical protein
VEREHAFRAFAAFLSICIQKVTKNLQAFPAKKQISNFCNNN